MKKIRLLLILPLFVNAKINTSHFETIKTINIPNCTNVVQHNYGYSPNTYNDSIPILIEGCMDTNASNFNADATDAGFDQYGNSICVYTSCDDIPAWGCIYADSFGTFNESFDAVACSSYGGTPCEEPSSDVEGCMDGHYLEYNPAANISNQSECITWKVEGCTDSTATNFDSAANVDDGSCTAIVSGCTDSLACNFDSAAQEDDGSCELPLEGFDCDGNCISGTLVTVDGGSFAYEISWTISDCDGTELASGGAPFASCVDLGDNYQLNLVDSFGDGWDGTIMTIEESTYTVEADAAYFIVGSCGVAGCTDDSACNFSADATFDDGTCDIPLEGFDCDNNCISGTLVTVDGGLFAYEISWTISDCDGTELASGGAPFASCVDLGDNYQLNLVDSYGDGWDGTIMTIEESTYTVEADAAYFTVGSCGIYGCMDTSACNFDSTATIDNETCEYAQEYYNCDGVCLNDYDNDGVCDENDYDDGIGIDEIKELKHRIYPNPVKNELNISHNHKREVLDIQIYNTIGLLIYEDHIETVENDVTIDVKNLPPGMYMINISNGKNNSSTKWIKKQ